MKYFSFTGNSFEQEIISSLKSFGTTKARAEEQLFVKYSYLIANGMRKYYICEDDAFNAYSDTILYVIQSITNGSFQEKATIKTYLHRIFYNKCVDITRKKASKRNSVYETIPIDLIEPYLSDNSVSIIEKLVEESQVNKLRQKMNQLCNNHRTLLMLSATGYTDKEIATVMSFKSIDVVKTTRLRCIKKLRRMLNQKELSAVGSQLSGGNHITPCIPES